MRARATSSSRPGYKAMLIHYMELFNQCGKAW